MSDQTAERLALCDPDAVPRFAAALGRARAYGTDAYIERDPWRTPERQKALVDGGFSQRLDSAHCHTRIDSGASPGTVGAVVPASRAIHLISREHFYFLQTLTLLPAFAVRIAAAALREGLISGVFYPPRRRDDETAEAHRQRLDYHDMHIRPMLRLACLDERWPEAEHVFGIARREGAAWDPMHIEWRPA